MFGLRGGKRKPLHVVDRRNFNQQEGEMRTSDKLSELTVILGTDHHKVGTLEEAYVDELGVTWAVMGTDTVQWGEDTKDGPVVETCSRVGRHEIPQTHVKEIALASWRWPGVDIAQIMDQVNA